MSRLIATVPNAYLSTSGCAMSFQAVHRFGPPPDARPLVSRPTSPARSPTVTPDVRGAQTILLVDDDEMLRQVMETCLSATGYQVIACDDARSAAEVFSSYRPIDILVSDLEMPGRSGLELARELTWRRPALPVLIVSGATLSDARSLEMLVRGWSFIAKPCRLEDLQAAVATLLQAGVGEPG